MAWNSPVPLWYKNNIEEYKRFLGTVLRTDGTRQDYVNHLHRCAAVILEEYGEIGLSEIDADKLARITGIMDVSPSSIERRLYVLGHFIQWRTGTNPCLDYRLRDHAKLTGYDITRIYRSELEAYENVLRERGCAEKGLHSSMNSIRACLRVLANGYGPLSYFEIGVEHIEYLVNNLAVSAGALGSYMHHFGAYVGYWIGENPVVGYREECRRRKTVEHIRSSQFGDLILEYAEYLQSRGYRPVTIKGRAYMVVNFFERGRRILGNLRLEQYDRNAFILIRNRTDDVKDNTLKQYMMAAGLFIEWALGSNPYDERSMMWNSPHIDRTFVFREEWDAIMRVSDVTDRTILMLGATLGMRRSEILRLKTSDLKDGKITIYGKGHGPNGKMVVKNVSPRLKATLDEYMEHRADLIRRYGDLSEGHLLVSETMYKVTPMTTCMLDRRIMRLSEKTGIEFSSHTFRRFYATTLYDVGTDLNTLRIMMRHESIDTTMRCYLSADPRRINKAETDLDAAMFG